MKQTKRFFVMALAALLLLVAVLPLVGVSAVSGAYPGFEPLYVLDLTDEGEDAGYANIVQLSISQNAGYTEFAAQGGDPGVWLRTPTCAVSDLGYAVIEYRTTCADSSGQFYAGFNPAPGISEETCITWAWVADGKWNRQIVDLTQYRETGAKTFSLLRFDPLQNFSGNPVGEGDILEVKSIAFLKTEKEANEYSIDDYHKHLDDLKAEEDDKLQDEEEAIKNSWQQPTYKEVDASALDNIDGSLTMTPSADGANMTISYQLNGETVSYTVPNKAGLTSGPLAGIDDLGRSLYNQYDEAEIHSLLPDYPVNAYGENGEHYVGIFYFLWMGEHGDYGILDMEKIIAAAGEDKAGSTLTAHWGPLNSMHHFAEPLYGYYYSSDEYVIRKHMELLTNAGVDFLYFDTTNARTYLHNVKKIMKVCHEMNEQGFDAPQVCFYTRTNAQAVVREVYNNIYSQNLYPDTWLIVEGKPVIMAPTSANINDFFTIRQDQWPNEAIKEGAWPWMSFKWQQDIFENPEGTIMAVSVAQQAGAGYFSASRLYGDRTNRGRSYDGRWSQKNGEYVYGENGNYRWLTKDPDNSYKYGYNFQSQFSYAYMNDVKYIMITGWNEWVAERQAHNFSGLTLPSDGVVFVDTCGVEFSRDIEMTRGYYFDNYYMQLIRNIQALKGAAPTIVQDGRKTINITGDFDQWDAIPVIYKDVNGDAIERNSLSFGRRLLTDTSNRNDIVASKVTLDQENLYFYIETASAIRKDEGNSTWMSIYLDVDNQVDEDGKQNGWYGYDYIINYERVDDFTTRVAKCNTTDGSYGFETVGDASIHVNDNKMMVSVPLSTLGISNYKEVYFTFKIADSDTKINTMEQFYTDGDVAPLGRTNYVFQNYIPGVSVSAPDPETTPETNPETDPETLPVSETLPEYETAEETAGETTDAPADTVAGTSDESVAETAAETPAATGGETEKPEDQGCGSIVGGAAVAAVAAAAVAGVALRRRED